MKIKQDEQAIKEYIHIDTLGHKELIPYDEKSKGVTYFYGLIKELH